MRFLKQYFSYRKEPTSRFKHEIKEAGQIVIIDNGMSFHRTPLSCRIQLFTLRLADNF